MARPGKQGLNGVDYGGAHAKQDYRNHGKSSSTVGYVVGASVVSLALIAGMGVVTVNTMDNMREHAASMQAATAVVGDGSANSSNMSSDKSDGLNGTESANSGSSTSESSAASDKSDSRSSSSSDLSSSASSDASVDSSSSSSASSEDGSEAFEGVVVSALDPADAEESKRRAEEIIAAKGGHIYYIHYGDTLSGISSQTGVSVQKIAHINEIDDVNLIYADSALVIPD